MLFSSSNAAVPHAMYQELLPYGISPLRAFFKNKTFINRLNQKNEIGKFDTDIPLMINTPESISGALLVSIHFSILFTITPFFIRRMYDSNNTFTILISRETFIKHPQWKKSLYIEAANKLDIEYLFAEDQSTLRKIYRRLKGKGTVFVFLDAAIQSVKNSRQETIPFIHHEITIPSALIELAVKNSFPIMPLVTHSSDFESSISFAEPITRNSCKDALISCFGFFGKSIIGNPSQWSQWHFLYSQSSQRISHGINNLASDIPSTTWLEDGAMLNFDFNHGILSELS